MNRVEELERAMRLYMLRAMPVDRTSTLSSFDLRSLITVYGNWRGRIPRAMARRVHVSSELLASPARDPYGHALSTIVRDIAFGADLSRYLSKGISVAYQKDDVPRVIDRPRSGRDRRRRQDLDLLLAEWGVHHLHLSAELDPSGAFVRRSDHVLLVAFRALDAYLIDLRRHESRGDNWAEVAILETIVRNWPDAGILERAHYVIGLKGGNRSDEDRRELRKAGVNMAVEIDGHVYMPQGQSLVGTPVPVERHAMKVRAELDALKEEADEPDATLRERARRRELPENGWRAGVYRDEFGFVNTGVFVPYGSLTPS